MFYIFVARSDIHPTEAIESSPPRVGESFAGRAVKASYSIHPRAIFRKLQSLHYTAHRQPHDIALCTTNAL